METYTPGHSTNATEFMSRRTIESHGAFLLPHLRDGVDILDGGCGPGSITRSVALRFPNARVVGVDFAESQLACAREQAQAAGIANVEFRTASAYVLPFADASFDVVLSHALLEHLAEPQRAVAEFHRVLRPGGIVGVCSPDWDGFLLAPPTTGIARAVRAYRELQGKNGGDVVVGRKLGRLLQQAGFRDVRMNARYEVYPATSLIAEYLALQLKGAGHPAEAGEFQKWACEPAAMFAQAWISAVGVRPL
jgi:SAM-dependent methyltransferase